MRRVGGGEVDWGGAIGRGGDLGGRGTVLGMGGSGSGWERMDQGPVGVEWVNWTATVPEK
jgi:hypothetical protein